MWKPMLLAVLSLSGMLTDCVRAGEEGLFSPLRLTTTSGSAGKAASSQSAPRALSNASAVQTLLLAAGYTARIDEHKMLRIELARGEWTAPVVIGLADGGRQLRMALRLTDPEANTTIAASTLRGMLQANRSHWGAFFAITGKPQRIELVKTLSNTGLNSDRLRDELDQLAEMAEKTRDIWKAAGVASRPSGGENEKADAADSRAAGAATGGGSDAAAGTGTSSTKTAATASAAPSLSGKWIAMPTTNEAFALQIDTDSRFKLVHVKGTKSTKSKGTWRLAGATLTLEGDDGTTIAGKVTRQSDRFTLTIGGAGGKSVDLTFKSGS